MNAGQEPKRLYRRKTVQQRLDGISVATLYRYMAKHGFPKPHKPNGSGSNFWDADSVDRWISERLTKSGEAA